MRELRAGCLQALRSAAVVVVTAFAASTGAQAASAETTLPVAGRHSMVVPAGYRASSQPLAAAQTGGEPLPIERSLVWLAAEQGRPPMLLVVESVSNSRGQFQWLEMCRGMKSTPHQFIHSPFHAMEDECVRVIENVDLRNALAQVFPDAPAELVRQGWELPACAGYFVNTHYGRATGAMLGVTAFIPAPFAGLGPSSDAALKNDSGLPDAVVSWATALGREVQKGGQSWSGVWQLPQVNEAQAAKP